MRLGGFLAVINPDGCDPLIGARAIAAAMARGWCAEPKTEQLLVFGSAGQAVRDGAGRGLILGRCYTRETRPRRVDEEDCRRLAVAGPDHAVSHFWGGFACFIAEPACSRVAVYRDPSGAMPVYHIAAGSALLLSTDVRLLFEVLRRRPAVNWSSVARGLLWRNLRGNQTALERVSELLPGSILTVQDGQASKVSVGWRPETFARAQTTLDVAGLSDELRSETQRCVSTCAGEYGRILLELSGGLDSSIVAACLRDHPSVASVTTWADGPGADERRWAREAAGAFGMPLSEVQGAAARIVPGHSAAAGAPWPCSRIFLQEIDRLHGQVAHSLGADALFSGGGGDNVFCHLQSAVPVTDQLLASWSPRSVVRTAAAVAKANGSTLPAALWRGLRRAIRPDLRFGWKRETGMLMMAVSGLSRPLHPWLDEVGPLQPGKQAQLRSLIVAQNHREGLARALITPVVFPLLSQPLVELCLSIPSYRWVHDGRDRAVARQAFAPDLPRSLIRRRTKGGFDSFADEIYRLHFDEIRSRLAEGRLVREGIVNREQVQQDYREADPAARLRVLELLDVEA